MDIPQHIKVQVCKYLYINDKTLVNIKNVSPSWQSAALEAMWTRYSIEIRPKFRVGMHRYSTKEDLEKLKIIPPEIKTVELFCQLGHHFVKDLEIHDNVTLNDDIFGLKCQRIESLCVSYTAGQLSKIPTIMRTNKTLKRIKVFEGHLLVADDSKLGEDYSSFVNSVRCLTSLRLEPHIRLSSITSLLDLIPHANDLHISSCMLESSKDIFKSSLSSPLKNHGEKKYSLKSLGFGKWGALDLTIQDSKSLEFDYPLFPNLTSISQIHEPYIYKMGEQDESQAVIIPIDCFFRSNAHQIADLSLTGLPQSLVELISWNSKFLKSLNLEYSLSKRDTVQWIKNFKALGNNFSELCHLCIKITGATYSIRKMTNAMFFEHPLLEAINSNDDGDEPISFDLNSNSPATTIFSWHNLRSLRIGFSILAGEEVFYPLSQFKALEYLSLALTVSNGSKRSCESLDSCSDKPNFPRLSELDLYVDYSPNLDFNCIDNIAGYFPVLRKFSTNIHDKDTLDRLKKRNAQIWFRQLDY